MRREATFGIDKSWALVLHELGISKSDVLRRGGLPEDLFEREGIRLSTERFFDLWRAIEESVGTAAFPMTLASNVTGDAFAPCLFSALCSPNMRVALDRLNTYKRVTAPMSLELERHDGCTCVVVHWLAAESPPPASLITFELAYLVHIARLATRQELRPVGVETQRPMLPARAYERWFGVSPVRSTRNALTFRDVDLELPFLTQNAGLWRMFEGELRQRLSELDGQSTSAERTRAALLQALPSGRGTLEQTAQMLGLSTRTLQRRLRQERTSFKDVLRETRQQLARHYLLQTDINSSEIGFLLGFDDTSSFFRAYRSWTGTTPESMRRGAG